MKKVKVYFVLIVMIASYSLTAQVSIKSDGSLPHPSAMLDVMATNKGMLIPRMTQAQRIAISTPANGLIVFQTNGENGLYYYQGTGWNRLGENAGHHVGELYNGGVVFWTDHLGEHGLICSMDDLSPSQAWSNITDIEIGPSAQSHWDGTGNSMAIVGQNGHVSSAAKLCLDHVNVDYGTGVFSDWYLPSLGEAIHLMNNLYEVQKALDTDGNPETTAITTSIYWSSTEYSNSSASVFSVAGATPIGSLLKSTNCYVRAVRAF